jgi:hypothetical protein
MHKCRINHLNKIQIIRRKWGCRRTWLVEEPGFETAPNAGNTGAVISGIILEPWVPEVGSDPGLCENMVL